MKATSTQARAPWLDRDDGVAVLEARAAAGRYPPEEAQRLRQWHDEGYFVVPGACPHDVADGIVRDLDALWSAEAPVEGLRVEEVKLQPGAPAGVSHAELLAAPPEVRHRVRHGGPWRVHGFHKHSAHARAAFQNPVVVHWASLVLDTPARPWMSITFEYGSEQGLHEDSAVTHIDPPNALVGVWTACEEIHPDCGPLVFYPGSHRRPMYEGFTDYPQTNLRTCTAEVTEAYHRHLDEAARGFERREFLARKGDVLLWHPMLIHGGSPVKDRRRTRRSFVAHYISPGTDRSGEVRGPFNW